MKCLQYKKKFGPEVLCEIPDVHICGQQCWGQVQLTKYSSTPSTPNVYQVQVLVKYSFFKKST